MYEELIKRLRRCEQFRCRECEYENVLGCRAKLNSEAADAIEELQGKNFLMKKTAEWISEKVPKWIPVTERFPKFGVRALCKCRANIYEVLTWTAEGWEYDPQHIYMSGFVTHWMPLPEPPKEEK